MMTSGQFYRKSRLESIISGRISSKKRPCKPSSLQSASPGFYLAYNLILKMEAICSSETSGSLRTILYYNPQDHTLFTVQIIYLQRTLLILRIP
jgi:hypothetical protein